MSKQKNKLTKPKPKRKAPSTAFKPGNPFAFKPGNSGNPSGKPKNEDALLSRGLRIDLPSRAPAAVCTAMGLPTTSSWSQVLRKRLLLEGAAGDISAIREIGDLTESKGGGGVNIGIAFGANAQPIDQEPQVHFIWFEAADGNGHLSKESADQRVRAGLPYPEGLVDPTGAKPAVVNDSPVIPVKRISQHEYDRSPLSRGYVKNGFAVIDDSTPGPADDDGPVIEGNVVKLGPE